MSVKPSEGLGKRVAKYRRLAQLSARELAERAGYGLTRGVIANIESGRKSDITVDQLIALASALGVPPVVLALPVDEPFRYVSLHDGESGSRRSRVHNAIDWFQGIQTVLPPTLKQMREEDENEATALANALIEAVREYPRVRENLRQLELKLEDGTAGADEVRVRELEVLNQERWLRQLGADLKEYKVRD